MAALVAIFHFRSERFLAFFELQVIPIFPTKFRVSWPFYSGEEAENYFHDGGHGGYLGFQTGTILAIFDLQVG